MSRIGKKIINIPTGVTVTVADKKVIAKGPKGELSLDLHQNVSVKVNGAELTVSVADQNNNAQKALWGTFGSLLKGLIIGVTEGYSKQLEVNGVGFKVALKGNILELALGFSHPIKFELPKAVTAKVEGNIITLNSIDKQLLGQVASQIRSYREPEPYKGKGIKHVEEVIRRKAGKSAASA